MRAAPLHIDKLNNVTLNRAHNLQFNTFVSLARYTAAPLPWNT